MGSYSWVTVSASSHLLAHIKGIVPSTFALVVKATQEPEAHRAWHLEHGQQRQGLGTFIA